MASNHEELWRDALTVQISSSGQDAELESFDLKSAISISTSQPYTKTMKWRSPSWRLVLLQIGLSLIPPACCLRGSWSKTSLFQVGLPSYLYHSNNHNNLSSSDILIKEIRAMSPLPLVISTWGFTEAVEKAWEVLDSNGTPLDAVEKGCTICEMLQCDGTVGFGGSPDENGETTLDAMIMDGETHTVGAVACLRRIKSAIAVARKVMDHTEHTLLAGDLATDFAIRMGFREETLTTDESTEMHQSWKNNSCQPNFWKNVVPDPTKSCGPYIAGKAGIVKHRTRQVDRYNHDTIGMVAIDAQGRIASGVSSNGARNKIPGRVGDAPIIGAGSYVDRDVGGAAATGDGDLMMRFLPSLIAVERMREGDSPTLAADTAIKRIIRFFPTFSGALVAVNLQGVYGAACHNIEGGFPYSVRNPQTGKVVTLRADCI